MKIFLNKIKNSLICFLGWISAGILTGCGKNLENQYQPVMYGMPPNYKYVQGEVVGEIEAEGVFELVQGIRYHIEGNNNSAGITDEDGNFVVGDTSGSSKYTVVFEDIDGDQNGSFKTKKVTFDLGTANDLEGQHVTLERKN